MGVLGFDKGCVNSNVNNSQPKKKVKKKIP